MKRTRPTEEHVIGVLKKANTMLDNAALTGLLSKRRRPRVIDAYRKSLRYRSTRDDDGGIRENLRDLANQPWPFGSRCLHILLRREGVMINRKKTQRIYREEGMAVRRRRSRRRAVGTRTPTPLNQRRSLAMCMIRWR